MMNSFAQPAYPSQRLNSVQDKVNVPQTGARRRGVDTAKSLSFMLFAAMVAAFVVVADQLMSTWTDGHLLAAWVALWVVGFATLSMFPGAARKLAATTVGLLDAWGQKVAQKRADERLWTLAQSDPRLMADLNAAIGRNER